MAAIVTSTRYLYLLVLTIRSTAIINVQEERILRERIVVHLHSSHISQNLKEATEKHRNHVCPCFVPDPQHGIDYEAETE